MLDNDTKIRVGILRGGAESHYEISLREGGDVISHILLNLSDGWKPVDILIDKDGIWHAGGLPINPADLGQKVDVIWNALHVSLSQVLENISIPNVGVNFFSSALRSSRAMLREHMKSIGVNMPRHIILPLYQEDFDGPREEYAAKKAKKIFEKFGSPWIVKSLTADPDMGIHVAATFPELVDAITDGVAHKKSILVEELIVGKDVSVHSVAGFRGEDVYIFPLGNFSITEKDKLTSLAKSISKNLGAPHYIKTDFILNPTKGIYLTNIEFSPDLKPDSNFCQSCESVGAKTHQVLGHMLESALR